MTVRERRECFVITNMRVFRLHGVLSTHRATMPLNRILDISVDKPLVGRILGFGHLIFESAAQDQGLREIKYVARADQRDLKIQRVVQVVGLRGPRQRCAGRSAASVRRVVTADDVRAVGSRCRAPTRGWSGVAGS